MGKKIRKRKIIIGSDKIYKLIYKLCQSETISQQREPYLYDLVYILQASLHVDGIFFSHQSLKQAQFH